MQTPHPKSGKVQGSNIVTGRGRSIFLYSKKKAPSWNPTASPTCFFEQITDGYCDFLFRVVRFRTTIVRFPIVEVASPSMIDPTYFFQLMFLLQLISSIIQTNKTSKGEVSGSRGVQQFSCTVAPFEQLLGWSFYRTGETSSNTTSKISL